MISCEKLSALDDNVIIVTLFLCFEVVTVNNQAGTDLKE